MLLHSNIELIKIKMMEQLHSAVIRLMVLLTLFCVSSCESFLEVDPPVDMILNELVFTDDATATSAVVGMYLHLYKGGSFASGDNTSIVTVAGLSSDELRNVPRVAPWIEFERNQLPEDNTYVKTLWETMYKVIYDANLILEGLSKSNGVTEATKNQLTGEALFIRAFCNFYLINCFGDVPLVKTTDYNINRALGRTSMDEIYDQIEADLLEAENLLVPEYPSAGRVRINKYAATAMLARVYLYRNDWARAEDKASNVIAQTTTYYLPNNLSVVFLSASPEAIWQLKPKGLASYTNEGYYFGTSQGKTNNILNDTILHAIELGDKRKNEWITNVTVNGEALYLPFKYKLQYVSTVESNEYSMVLRTAEQFLIRAEARAHQPGKLTGPNSAQSDINMIRSRAGLSNTTAVTEEELLLAIDQERRIEFLAEWGHRWFDLKRRGRTDEVLGPVKDNWSPNDELYPLPADEMRKNVNLRPQNPGY